MERINTFLLSLGVLFNWYILMMTVVTLSSCAEGLRVNLHDQKSEQNLFQALHKRDKKGKTLIPIPYINFKKNMNSTVQATLFTEIELICEVSSFPPANIRWLKNDEDFAYMQNKSPYVEAVADQETENYLALIRTWGTNVYSVNIGGTKSKLKIECLSPEDIGQYTCVAETKFQQKMISTRLVLNKSSVSKINDLTTNFDNFYCSKDTFIKVPIVMSWTSVIMELQGQNVVIFCRYNNGEKSFTKWFGPENEIIAHTSEKYKILDNGDLLLRNLAWNDMGSYTCIKQTLSRSEEMQTFIYPLKPEPQTNSNK